jgi:ACS family sodium-dependent inorganic phosphate cotransporter
MAFPRLFVCWDKNRARWALCWMLAVVRIVCQSNRIILGSLMPYIMHDIQYTMTEKAELLSAFATGYMLTQIVGGAAADYFGGKHIITFSVAAISLGSLLAPTMAERGFGYFWMTYFVMGFCEGPNQPTLNSMLSKWIPKTEKSRAAGMADIGNSVGGIIALMIGPMIATRYHWKDSLHGFGAVSLTFTFVWAALAHSTPQTAPLDPEERELLMREGLVRDMLKTEDEEVKKPAGNKQLFPWQFFTYASVWSVCYSHFAFNFGRYFVYAWTPIFYVEMLGVTPDVAGEHLFVCQIFDLMGKYEVTQCADWAIEKKYCTVLQVRRFVTCVAFFGYGASMFACAYARNIWLVTLFLTLGRFAGSMHAVCGHSYIHRTHTSVHTHAPLYTHLHTVAHTHAYLCSYSHRLASRPTISI